MQLFTWLDITVRSVTVYLALLVGLRLAGKRHSGQLSPHDFVLILLVSNAVQNAMVGDNVTLGGGLAAAATLIVLNVLVTRFVLRNRRWRRMIAGEPTLLIHKGRVLPEALDREGILQEELLAQLRSQGFEGPEEVKNAVEECDGSISVLGYGSAEEYRVAPLRPRNRLIMTRPARSSGEPQ